MSHGPTDLEDHKTEESSVSNYIPGADEMSLINKEVLDDLETDFLDDPAVRDWYNRVLHWVQRNSYAYSRIVYMQLVITSSLLSFSLFCVFDNEETRYGPPLGLITSMLVADVSAVLCDLCLIKSRYRFMIPLKQIVSSVSIALGVAIIVLYQLSKDNFNHWVSRFIFLITIYIG